MASIILLALIVAVSVALLGSVLIQSSTSINDIILSPVEKKCQEIANEASIATVVGTKPGKGFSEESGQKSWFSESHR